MIIHSIGYDAAIDLANSGWWKEKTAEEIVRFQLFIEELSMPFAEFHKAVEDVLKRPVWTHEFADFGRLQEELLGERPPPSFVDIMDMIPKEKRILVCI